MADENENEREDAVADDEESNEGREVDGEDASASEASEPDEPSAAESDEEHERRVAREAEAERKQLERESEVEDDGSVAALLGPERWVQFAFIAAGVALFFLTDRLTSLIWGRFDEPDPAIVSAIAGATAIFGTFALYRHPAVNKLADEVVTELSKVTWPTRDEVWTSTIVVVVTSIVAAVYTGAFDAMWSAITNIVYG
jgi:preprotein translocase subunit SecE